MSARWLQVASTMIQVALGTLNCFMLPMSIFVTTLAAIVIVNIRVGFELISSVFFVKQQSDPFLQGHQLIHNQHVELLNDLLTIGDMYPSAVRFIAICFSLFSLFFVCLTAIGCYAVISKSVFMTELFTFGCGIFLVLFSSFGTLLVFRADCLEALLKTEARQFISNDYSSMIDDVTMRGNFIDFVQARVGCCGVTNSSDFGRTFFPVSCCRLHRLGQYHAYAAPVFVRRFNSCPEMASEENSNMAIGCFRIVWRWATKLLFRTVSFLLIPWTLSLASALLLRQTLYSAPPDNFYERVGTAPI